MVKRIKKIPIALSLVMAMGGLGFAQGTNVERVAGNSRYETSVKLSRRGFNNADTVILASGEGFADALSGGQLALAYKCPLILTPKNSVAKVVKDEIKRLNPKKIVILGGEGSISKKIEAELSGYKVQRIAGASRYDTSRKIMEETIKITKSSKVVVVNGRNYPDALSAIGYMAKTNSAMILSDGRTIPKLSQEMIAIGGANSLSLPGFKGSRIAGGDRYETALNVAKAGYGNAGEAILVNGEKYPDALSATSLLSKNKMPVLLTNKVRLNTGVKSYLEKTNKVIVVGGINSVSQEVVSSLSKTQIDTENVGTYQNKDFFNMIRITCTPKMISEVGMDQSIIGPEKVIKFYNKLALKHDRENMNGINGSLAGLYGTLGIVEESKYDPPKYPSPNNDKLKLGSLQKDGKNYIVFISPAHEIYADLENDKVAVQFVEDSNEFLEALFSIQPISGKYTPGGNGYEYLKKIYEDKSE